MDLKSIGIDIEEAGRFRQLLYATNKNFYKKIFTEKEIKYCLSKSDPYQHFAGKFAAKEAVIKALGSTIYKAKNIEILNDKKGAPVAKFKIQGLKFRVLTSISHTKDHAIAIAMAF